MRCSLIVLLLSLAAACSVLERAPPPPVSPVASAPAPAATPKPATPPAAAPKPATPPAPTAAAKPAAAPQLNLTELEKRLRATPAIGTFTKLSLKNSVDDLTAQFKAYHEGRSKAKLQELRQPYELLIMKVLSLLQDQDPALAGDISRSRDAIWGILSDKNKFMQI